MERNIAIVGAKSVGKSSLIIQFGEGQFKNSSDTKTENTLSTKITSVRVLDYNVKLVETACQDMDNIFPAQNNMDFHGYVFVYSITDRASFDVVQSIHEKLLGVMGKPKYLPVVLVGNKTDLHEERAVTADEGKRLATSWNAYFVETSAKQNDSSIILFTMLMYSELQNIHARLQRLEQDAERTETNKTNAISQQNEHKKGIFAKMLIALRTLVNGTDEARIGQTVGLQENKIMLV